MPILIAAMLWGTTGTASSLAHATASAAAIGAAGLALGGLLLFLTTPGSRTLPAACSTSERRLLALGSLAVAGYPITFYPAIARTGVAVATVVALGSAPIFTGLLTWLTSQVRSTTRWSAATLTALLGCTMLIMGPQLTTHPARMDLAGIALAALAGLSYACYSLIGGTLINQGHPSASVMGVMFGVAALLVTPLLLSADPHWLLTPRGAAVALHLAIFTTFLAYRLFGHGLRHTPAQVATALTLVEPAVAATLAVTVLGERLPAVSWCGMAVLAVSLTALTTPQETPTTTGQRTIPRRSGPDATNPPGPGLRPGRIHEPAKSDTTSEIGRQANSPRRQNSPQD